MTQAGALAERAEQVLLAWVAEAGVEHDLGSRPGEHVLVLPGEAKLRTSVSVLVGEVSLQVSAFVVRRPDENQEEFGRWLLRRNLRLPGIAFAVDTVGDVYLVGRVPVDGLTSETVDRLLGAVLATADDSFNDLLALGFLSSMRREWAWRVDRGESTRNLEAFRHLLEPSAPGPEDDGSGAASR